MLPTAYTQQPGEPPPRYDLATAERALRCIATRMNKDGTRDLQWWHVPAWAPVAPRFIATWLGAALVAGLAGGVVGFVGVGGYPGGLADGLGAGIPLGIVAGMVAGITFGRGNKLPKRMTPVRWRQLFRRRPLIVGFQVGLVVGILTWAVFRAFNWLVSGLAFGLVAWVEAGVVAGMSRPGTDNTSPLSPRSSWRSDQAFGLVAGLAIWLGVALVLGFMYWLALRSWIAVVVLFLAGLLLGLMAGLVYPQSWSSSLAFTQLAASERTPVRLLRFLEDAHRRSVLRTVGPVYQFRHARLQDRLAAQGSATTGQELGEPQQ